MTRKDHEYEIEWDDTYQDYSVRRLLDGTIFSVTANALAVITDSEYRKAVEATNRHLKRQMH